ncbi:MAG: hypothetical protein GY809_30780, partial [Planctomycetes bacterium]|nr:hypothetical protein [Planctomycetota bacterium]
MNREQAEKLLGALIFDDLDEQSKAQLIAYLETDEDLRESLADLRMALKVTTDAVHQGPDPVLSDTRLKRLERLSRSKGRPSARLFARWMSVAAVIAIGLWVSIPRIGESSADARRKINMGLARDASRMNETDSLPANRPSRGSGRAAETGGQIASDGLGRAGERVTDSTWQMQEAEDRPLALGLEVAKQTESLGAAKPQQDLNDDLGSFGNSSGTANDKFYGYSGATELEANQRAGGVLSWNRPDEGRGEVLRERLLTQTDGRTRGQSVDLYAMHDAQALSEQDADMAAEAAGSDRIAFFAPPKTTTSGAHLYGEALGQQVQSQTSSLRRGALPGGTHSGLPAISSTPTAPRAVRPAEPLLPVRKNFEGAVARHERLPSKPEQGARGASSRYGRSLTGEPTTDRMSSSRRAPQDRPALRLADKEPEVASLSKRVRRLKDESGLGTDGRQAGRDAFGEDASREYDVAAKSSTQNTRTGLKLDAPTDFGFSEVKAADRGHGLKLEAKAAEKVATLGDVSPVEGPFRSVDGSMGGMMGGSMRGGMLGGQIPSGSVGGGMMGGSMGGGMMGGGMGGGMGRGIAPPALQTQGVQGVLSGEAPEPQQVLLQTQVVKVDEGALQDLGFQKDLLSEQNGMTVWSYQNGKSRLDSVIDKLKRTDQLQVVATPSTMAQHGKEARMSVITEEYFMLSPAQELGGLGLATHESEAPDASINMNLTPYVGDQQVITLDMDLKYTPVPQGRSSGRSEGPSVRSNSVSLEDGDSVILINPKKKQRGQNQTHEAVIVTANLLPHADAQPEVRSAQTPDEFTLPPASRFKQMPVNPWVL